MFSTPSPLGGVGCHPEVSRYTRLGWAPTPGHSQALSVPPNTGNIPKVPWTWALIITETAKWEDVGSMSYFTILISSSLDLFSNITFCLFVFVFWLHSVPCGTLVPQPGIEPVPIALETQSLNHWTAREVPYLLFFNIPINA